MYSNESERMRSSPWSQPLVVVPRKMTKVPTATTTAVAGPESPMAMPPTIIPATIPVPPLISLAKRIAEFLAL